MIEVHETFVCKPGNASKFAKLMKEASGPDKNFKYVMTDMVGQYNRVVAVFRYEDLEEYKKAFDNYKNPTPEMKEAMKSMEGYTEMYLTGGRDIFQVW
jgi:hypothetical protein